MHVGGHLSIAPNFFSKFILPPLQCVFHISLFHVWLCFALMLAMTLPVLLVKNSPSIFRWSRQSTVEAQIGVNPFNTPGQCYFQFWPLLWYFSVHSCYNTFYCILLCFCTSHSPLSICYFMCTNPLFSVKFMFTQRKFWTSSCISSHQSSVKYIADVFVNTCWIKLNYIWGFQSCICYTSVLWGYFKSFISREKEVSSTHSSTETKSSWVLS